MATGKPSITTPRTLDLRRIQQALDAIRERLRQSDAELNLLRSFADANQSAQAIASLQGQIAQLSSVLNALVAQVTAIGEVSDPASLTLANDAKIRAVAQEAFFMVPAPNDATSVLANRVFRA